MVALSLILRVNSAVHLLREHYGSWFSNADNDCFNDA